MSLGKWQRQVACRTLRYKPWPAYNASLIPRPSPSPSGIVAPRDSRLVYLRHGVTIAAAPRLAEFPGRFVE